jgi:hypothetical protein
MCVPLRMFEVAGFGEALACAPRRCSRGSCTDFLATRARMRAALDSLLG